MIFVFWLTFSILVGYLASTKGRSGFGYFLLSAIFSPIIGLLVVLILKDINEDNALITGELKRCHACAELIKSEAIKCKHCGEPQKQDANEDALQSLISQLKDK